MAWDTAVYTSEIGFFFDLPFFFYTDPSPFRMGLFVCRLLVNAVALSLISYDPKFLFVGGILLAISFFAHLAVFVYNKARRPAIPINNKLYWASHFSITNFVLDTPGRGIPIVKFSHALLVVLSVIPVAILTFTWFLITPIETAWACYDPAYIKSLEDYKFGLCAFNDMCTLPQINCNQKAKILSTEFHFALQLFGFLFIIQLATVPNKITWYKKKEYDEKLK